MVLARVFVGVAGREKVVAVLEERTEDGKRQSCCGINAVKTLSVGVLTLKSGELSVCLAVPAPAVSALLMVVGWSGFYALWERRMISKQSMNSTLDVDSL